MASASNPSWFGYPNSGFPNQSRGSNQTHSAFSYSYGASHASFGSGSQGSPNTGCLHQWSSWISTTGGPSYRFCFWCLGQEWKLPCPGGHRFSAPKLFPLSGSDWYRSCLDCQHSEMLFGIGDETGTLEWASRLYEEEMIIKFGKHAGTDIRDVPTDYLDWLLGSNENTIREIKGELQRREELEASKLSWMEQVVKEGVKALAKKHHPDIGGAVGTMQEINRAGDLMSDMARRAKGAKQT